MNLCGIGYLGLAVPDVAAWSDFAVDVIGLMQVADPGGERDDDSAYFKADDRQWRLAVHRSAEPGIAYVGFEVSDEPAFHDAVAQLDAAGVAPKPATEDELVARGVRQMVHVQDPSGIRVEICWGPTVDTGFHSPVGASGFVTRNGLGHYVLLVSNLEASMDFYLGVMDMKLTDYTDIGPGMSVHFLRCTPRHHSVALTAVGPIEGLHHIAFELPDVDQVGLAHDRAVRAGVPITASLGRHKNDQMFSFYMRSPAGFDVELGCGARLVDDQTWVANRFVGDVWGHHGLTGEAMAEAVAKADK